MQVIDAGNRVALILNDDISFAQASLLGSAVNLNRDDEDAALNWQAMETHKAARQGHVLPAHPKVTPPDLALFDEQASDKLRRVDRHREAEALGWQDDRRIDADDIPARRDQGTTRVTRIECRVGLDEVLDKPPRPRPQRAPEGAHHPSSHRALEAVGVADGDHQLPHS